MRSADPSLSAAERADAACDEFEAAHRAGKAPRVDEYVARVPEAERADLRAALAAVEAELSGSAAVPVRVGRFEVRGELGAGAFGRVYRAYDPNLQREVALKVPQPGALRTAADRDRFLKEARAAATVSHPNVCPIHEVGEADGRPYIVMPLVPGHTLAAALRKRTEPLPEKQVALIVRKLALALDAAHKKGVIHRDLKPANVMFDRERNDLVVMDFGLARRADAESGAGDTRSGVILGTPAYMSPEQARGGAKDVGPAADVFALGAMMYEMLTGHRPFSGGSANEVIGRILLLNPEPPSVLRSGVSPVLEAACLKALAKDPAARFASMREFATAVDTFLRAPTPAAETAVAVETVPMAAPVEGDADGDVGLSTNTRKLADLFGALSEQQEAHRAETEEAIERAVAKARTPRWVFAAVGVLALAALAALAVVVLSGPRAVKVALHLDGIDLTDKSLSFALDGKPISAEALAQPIDLKPGEHELVVFRGAKKVKRLLFTVTGGRAPRVEYRSDDEPDGDGNGGGGPTAPVTGLELVKTLPHKEYVGDVRFSADGTQLLTACPGIGDGKGGTEGAGVFAWSAKTWEPLGAVVEHPTVTKVLPVGGRLVVCVSGASGSFGRVPAEFVVWNPAKRARDLKFAVEMCGGVRALDALPDGKSYLASIHEGQLGSLPPSVAVYDLATGETRLKLASAAGCVANDKDGKSIIAAFGPELRQIDIASEKVLRTLKGHTADVFFVTSSADGRFAASCAAGKDNELILWNLTATDGAPVVLGKFKVPATCLAFSPNGKYLLSGSGEGVVKLWDVGERKEIASVRADAQSLHAVRFSPDGAFAVTGGNADKAAKVWKLARAGAQPKAPPAPNADRAAAEWVLKNAGWVFIVQDGGQPRQITALEDLPRTPFQLQALSLWGGEPKTKVQDADLKLIEGLKGLEIVNLTGCPLSDKAVESLVTLPNLQRLRFEGTQITEEGLKNLGRVPRLVELHVQQTTLSGAGFATWRNSPLVHLTIGGVVTTEGAKHIAALSNLRSLLIASRTLDDDGMKYLAALRLETFGVASPKITDKGVEPLAAMQTLSTLQLENLSATANALKSVAALRGLGHLVISGDWVTDEGIAHLRGTELFMLSLHPRDYTPLSRNVTSAAVKHIAEINSLGSLNLSGTGVTDACIPDLLRTKRLVHLGLKDTKVTNDGLWKLKEGLSKCEVEPQPTGPAPEAGFVSIFNGKDLTGWDAPSRPESFGVDPEGLLTVKGDTPAGGVHWLYTKQQYTDYVLRLEFKFALPNPTGTAAAVAPRAALEKGATGARSQRVRVPLRNHGDAPRTGAVMYTVSDLVEPKQPPGELATGTWHALELEVRGANVRVTVNGKLVNDVDLSKIDRTLLAKTERWAEAELDRRKGHIGLMSWRNPVKFRNIRVKELGGGAPAVGPSDGFTGLELVQALPHQMLVSDAIYSPDGSKLLTSCYNGEPADQRGVHMWDAKTGKPLGKPAVLINIGKLAYQHGKLVFGEHGNGGLGVPSRVQLHVWNPTKWARDTAFSFDGEKPGNVNSLEVLPGGKSVLASRWTHEGSRSDTAIFDLATGEHKLKVAGYASSYANDGTTILVGDGTELKQIEIATAKVTRTFKTHTQAILCVACSPNGRFVATSSASPTNEIILWDLAAPDGAPVLLGKQKASVPCLAFAPNGKSLLSGSTEGVLKLWDVAERKEVAAVRADEGRVNSVAFSPDGTHAVTGCQEAKAAKVWKLTK